ncbi:MAG: hypothetical protein K2X27_12320 [Candidatus Obscuribacterales bacterium]|nr:hypothetical protein [Candidatus Obscuribacterales bacterium]
MKSIRLTLSLVIGGLLLAPQAMAQQFGMDDQYQQYMQYQAQNSTADTGEGPHNNGTTTQDAQYLTKQEAPWGNASAPLIKTQGGTISTFKGNIGNKFVNAPLLPTAQQGLMSVLGGYTGNACGKAGSGGFSGSGGGSFLYPLLPATSTSTVDLNTAF